MRPFIEPNSERHGLRAGDNVATGRPRLVTTTDLPVRATESMSSRQVALNSAAEIVDGRVLPRSILMTMVVTIPRCHGDGHVHERRAPVGASTDRLDGSTGLPNSRHDRHRRWRGQCLRSLV